MFELAKSVNKTGGVEDDLKILRNWVEYSEDRQTAESLMYEFEMEDESGNVQHLFKCVKLVRIVRLPKGAKESTTMMRIHSRMLQGLWHNNINFVTVIANILTPVPFGLMYLYGIQSVATTEAEAMEKANIDYMAMLSLLQGTYRVLEYKRLSYQELEWLREKMFSMKNMVVVRGIPKAKESGRKGANPNDPGAGKGMKVTPDEDQTSEEFIAGMSDKEYVVQILSTPVKAEHLERWLAQTAQEMTRFNSQLQGSSNLGFNLSIPMMYMGNVGASEGWSHAYTESDVESVTVSNTLQNTFSTSVGESISQSFGESIGRSYTQSFNETIGENYSTGFGVSQGTNWGESVGMSQGTSQGFSESFSSGRSYNLSETNSSSHADSTSLSVSEGTSTNTSTTHSESTGVSDSITNSETSSQGRSFNSTLGWSSNRGGATSNSETISSTDTSGTSASISQGRTHADTTTNSLNINTSDKFSYTENETHGETDTTTDTRTTRTGFRVNLLIVRYSNERTTTTTTTHTENETWGTSRGFEVGTSRGQGWSSGDTYSRSLTNTQGSSNSHSLGNSNTLTNSESWSNGINGSTSRGYGSSTTQGISQTHSVSDTTSDSTTMGYGTSRNVSQGIGASDATTHGTGENWGQTASNSQGTNVGSNQSANAGQNIGGNSTVSKNDTWGLTQSRSYGSNVTDSFTSSATSSAGRSYSENNGLTQSQGWNTTESRSSGQTYSKTGGVSRGTSSSLGAAPSVGMNIMYQWLDQEVKNILTLLDFQNMRLMNALKGGNGAFFTDVYIATPDNETQQAASILAKAAWMDESSLICPLQVLNLKDEEQKHLLYHFSAFSADNTKVNDRRQMQSYKYSTILLPLEYTAYTHLPRISDGGVYADVGDVPKFAIPSMKKGDIYMGKILSGERWTIGDKYESIFEYRLDESELMHGIFTGESRSGKTVAATRFVVELTKVRRTKTGKRLRIVARDPKQDWRVLGKFVEPERFHFYSLGNPEFLPINLNICKVPHNVNPQVWVDGVIEIFCRSYGLLERGKAILAESFYSLYEDAGVFEDSPNWRDFVPERSSKVTMAKIYERMLKIKVALDDPAISKRGRMGTEAMDAYACILDRLQVFGRKFSIEARLFSREDGIAIDELIGGDDIIVLESYGLETTFKNFIFGCITSGFFKYAQGHEGGFLAADQYETVLIVEEANEVLTGSDTAGSKKGGAQMSLGGQSEFEKILDQSAGLGLFIIAITQKIADMPSSCVANAGLVFAGKISRADDVTLVIRKIGREERYDDRDILKWFPRSPIGWFVCRSSRNFDFKETEPSLVHIDPLGVDPPTNIELEGIMAEKRAMALLNS